MSTCRSCSAPIVWAQSFTTKKLMPFDAAPAPALTRGAFTITAGIAHAATSADHERGTALYVSHFSTCPDRDKWRTTPKLPGVT